MRWERLWRRVTAEEWGSEAGWVVAGVDASVNVEGELAGEPVFGNGGLDRFFHRGLGRLERLLDTTEIGRLWQRKRKTGHGASIRM